MSDVLPPRSMQIFTGHFVQRGRYATRREHGTDDWLIIYTVAGKGRFGTGNSEFHTRAGEVVLFRPGALHDYGLEPRRRYWNLLWAHFIPRASWLEWMRWTQVAPGIMRLTLTGRTKSQAHASLREMHRLASGSEPMRENLALNALERAILWCAQADPRSGHQQVDPRVQHSMQYILENLAGPLSIPQVAQEVELSASRLAALFRAQIGQSLQRFIEHQRLSRASQLLQLTSRSVTDIAHDVGFANPFYFALRFRRHTGRSPREYRRRHASKASARR